VETMGDEKEGDEKECCKQDGLPLKAQRDFRP
jgi:hypothetical protein